MKVSSHSVNIEENTTVPDDAMHVCAGELDGGGGVCWGWGGREDVGEQMCCRKTSRVGVVGDGVRVRKTFMPRTFFCTVASGWSRRRAPAVGWRRRSARRLVHWPAVSEIIHLRQHNFKIWVISGVTVDGVPKALDVFAYRKTKPKTKSCQLVKAVTESGVLSSNKNLSKKKAFPVS